MARTNEIFGLLIIASVTACGAPPAACPETSETPVVTGAQTTGAETDDPQSTEDPSDPRPAMDQVHLEAIECRSLTDHVLVRLRLTEDGTQFVGQAHDHYDTAEYTGCELTATELTCEAQWQGAEASAALRIHIGPSGTLVGTVRRARARSGVMGCLQVERRGN